jgi:hypothetical protein
MEVRGQSAPRPSRFTPGKGPLHTPLTNLLYLEAATFRPPGAGWSSFRHSVQSESGTLPVGIGGSLPGIEAARS